jgi:hypothetical protein
MTRKLAKRLKKRNRQELRQSAFLSGSSRILQDWQRVVDTLASESRTIAELPDSVATEVRAARRQYLRYVHDQVDPVKERLDAWTAVFFWPIKSSQTLPPTTNDLVPDSRGMATGLTELQRADIGALSQRNRFFHWQLEFPEVFEHNGFDCVLGNPPWERIKLQEHEFFAERDPEIAKAPNKAARDRLIKELASCLDGRRFLYAEFQAAKRSAEATGKFVRESGLYPLTAVGDVNLYPLFTERSLVSLNGRGRTGLVVPTGIVTDDSTKTFFQHAAKQESLASVYGFFEVRQIFAGTDNRAAFALLTLCNERVARADLAFLLTSTDQLRDERRRFQFSAEDFALLNPNTRSCPVFRTHADADLTRTIYRRVPVLVDETRETNQWGLIYRQGLFHSSNDAGMFNDNTASKLRERGARLSGNQFQLNGAVLLPLYEGKMVHQYQHRHGTYEGVLVSAGNQVPSPEPAKLQDPNYTTLPHYWVDQSEVRSRLSGLGWSHEWLIAFRDVARATDERTGIFTVLPVSGLIDQFGLVVLTTQFESARVSCLIGNLNSLVFDYCLRPKVGGIHVKKYTLYQTAALAPSDYSDADMLFIKARVLELTYTAVDLRDFARFMDYEGPPFRWDEDRRAVLRAELDAYFGALYSLTRDELRFILNPQDVYGSDFPGETFRVLKEREIKQYGEYRTGRLVLEAWDRLGLEPRNGNGRYCMSSALTPSGVAVSLPVVESPLVESDVNELGQDGLTRRTVRERARTQVRSIPLLPTHERPPKTSVSASPDSPTPAAPRQHAPPGSRLSPPSQPQLPGLSGGTLELRERVLKRSLDALRSSGALSGREIAQRLVQLDKRIDRHLVNSVLSHEGAQFVRHDSVSGKYRIKTR